MVETVNIREMHDRDVDAVSAICMAAFSQAVADTLSDEGVATFSNIAATNAFLDRMQGDNRLLVAENHGTIVGVIELKEGRHVAMFFVSPGCQQQGIGRMLLRAALEHARVDTVTVSASLSSVPAYKKYGFVCRGDSAESAGLIYQPMVFERHQATDEHH